MTMDAARMHALACRYAEEATRENLEEALNAALPLCALIARRFSSRGGEYDDLYQAACLACVRALRGFDPEKGFKFTTYVTPVITGARSGVPFGRANAEDWIICVNGRPALVANETFTMDDADGLNGRAYGIMRALSLT